MQLRSGPFRSYLHILALPGVFIVTDGGKPNSLLNPLCYTKQLLVLEGGADKL